MHDCDLRDLTWTAIPKKRGNKEIEDIPYQEEIPPRMPSASRAYPLALEKKAGYYMNIFDFEGLTTNSNKK